MLGREYELLPVPPGRPAGQATSLESAWVCQAVGDPDDSSREQGRGSAGPIARVDVPVRESSGLVWAWPDTSPEGGLPLKPSLCQQVLCRGTPSRGGGGWNSFYQGTDDKMRPQRSPRVAPQLLITRGIHEWVNSVT